jgi:hypothetical protein
MAFTALERLNVPLFEEHTVETTLRLPTLRSIWVKGSVQGEDVNVLVLLEEGKGNTLSRKASTNVWLELGPAVGTSQAVLLGLSNSSHVFGVDSDYTDCVPLVAAVGTNTGRHCCLP